jgi:hypothetical protein
VFTVVLWGKQRRWGSPRRGKWGGGSYGARPQSRSSLGFPWCEHFKDKDFTLCFPQCIQHMFMGRQYLQSGCCLACPQVGFSPHCICTLGLRNSQLLNNLVSVAWIRGLWRVVMISWGSRGFCRAAGVAQVLGLPSKCKALWSNPSTSKRKEDSAKISCWNGNRRDLDRKWQAQPAAYWNCRSSFLESF